MSPSTEARPTGHDLRLEHFLESMGDGVILLDRTGAVRLMNSTGRRMLDSLGARMEDHRLVALGELDLKELLDAAWTGSGRSTAIESRCPEGEKQVFSLALSPVRSDVGEIEELLLQLRDITKEHALQDHLWQTVKLTSVGQLVSGVAHELNNPLTAVLGYAQLLPRTATLDDQCLDVVQRIVKEADRARRIVQNLLAFARNHKPAKVRLQINELIEQTIELRGYDLRVNNIEVDTVLASDLPDTSGDAQPLQQAFLNLINNAAEAIMSGAGRGRLELQTRRAGDHIEITIQDSGPGVPREIAGKIFDPFFTTKPARRGTGLGLAVSRGIISEHQGTMNLTNAGQPGATFVIQLPVIPPGNDPPASMEQPTVVMAPTSMSKSILLVEDEEVILQLMEHVLSTEGYDCQMATNGQKALEQTRKKRFDLVITDLQMPVMGGQELYRELIKADPQMAHCILFLTGDSVSGETNRFLESAGCRYIEKPFRVEQLRALVRGFFGDAA